MVKPADFYVKNRGGFFRWLPCCHYHFAGVVPPYCAREIGREPPGVAKHFWRKVFMPYAPPAHGAGDFAWSFGVPENLDISDGG